MGEAGRSWNSTLPARKTPLRAKKQWRSQQKPLKRTPLKKVSQSQKNRLKKYDAMRREFLAQPENEFCEVCKARREHGENIRVNYSSEVHHKYLRAGANLFRGFVASCFPCRLWPHENPAKARELGLLA